MTILANAQKILRIRFDVSIRTALLSTVMFLTLLGVLSVFASSGVFAMQNYGSEWLFVQKQLIVALLGFSLVFLVGHLPLSMLNRVPLLLYGISLLSLILIFVPGIGHTAKGATRWVQLGFFGFQPSELAKLATVMLVAKNLARSNYDNANIKSLLGTLLIFFAAAALIALQPDLGTVAVLGLVVLIMMWFHGMPRKLLVSLIVSALLGLAAMIAIAPYRLQRLTVFWDPWREYARGGFQVIQSLLAYHSGGLLGRGLGESNQKLFFLPDAHTDFILAIIGEEFGLVGTLTVLLMFAYLTYLGFLIVRIQIDKYYRLLALGLTSLLAVQCLVNMAVTMGMIPTKGIGLPFVSNGRSSLFCYFLAVAILSRLSQPDVRQTSNR